VAELAPTPDELVLDKITMSAFEGTPLDIVLRDCGIDAFAVAGISRWKSGSSPPCGTRSTLAIFP
jgi:nicotinamidase-related amidase